MNNKLKYLSNREGGDTHVAVVGERHVWGGSRAFGLSPRDRLQHVFFVGKSGTGKTTTLRNLLTQDIDAGFGVGLIDPHGDLADELLDHIPPCRSRDVVYFNPADPDYPVAVNVLAGARNRASHLIASAVVAAFKSIWHESWGPRLEHFLFATVGALSECPNTSLLGVPRMLVDERYRRWVVNQVTDPAVRSFWLDEVPAYDNRLLSEAVAPIQNKVGQLLMSAPLRNVLGQARNAVDFRWLMDNRKVFVANLAKGRIGDDKAKLLGALLVTQFEQAALSRADVPEGQRPAFFLTVDESHNFVTDSFASMLAESRKYGLGLVLSTQHLGQWRQDLRESVLGNAGTVISFRVGEADARVLEREFGNGWRAELFTDLADYEVLVKLLDGGRCGEPFRGTTLPPLGRFYGRRDRILRTSRERYGTPRAVVEDRIERWMRKM